MFPALRSALRLASGPLQRRLAAMELIPPLEFPCRIEPLPEGCSTIDNSLYNDTQYASSWHSTDRSKELATLDLLNAARIPYFDRVWRRQLDLPPTLLTDPSKAEGSKSRGEIQGSLALTER